MGYIGHIDVMSDFEISGWASDNKDRNKRISVDIKVNGKHVATCKACRFRDDLLAAGVSDGYSSFSYSPNESLDIAHNDIQIFFSGTRISVPREITDSEKKKRFENYIFPLLKCISCESIHLNLGDEKITCEKCGREYIVNNYIPVMVLDPDVEKIFTYSNDVVAETSYSDELTELLMNYERGICYLLVIVPNKHSIYPEHIKDKYLSEKRVTRTDVEKIFTYSNDVVAETSYSDELTELLMNYERGPVLDLGSGHNSNVFPDFGTVKLDIFPFPNVDVVGYGENLPFKPDTFEAIISMSAFEHVQNPFLLAHNIKQTLAPDGELYIETAFLQPVHAYPNHYFNMTKQGLEYLCSDFDKIGSGVHIHQFPSFTLNWILKSWCKKLNGKNKEDFLNVTVREILEEYSSNQFSRRWMDTFSTEDLEELACGVYFHGRKV